MPLPAKIFKYEKYLLRIRLQLPKGFKKNSELNTMLIRQDAGLGNKELNAKEYLKGSNSISNIDGNLTLTNRLGSSREFGLFKKATLEKIKHDKSNKGSIDKPILPLVNFINSLKDYFTTSSCSGRICINKEYDDLRKSCNVWVFKSHSIVNPKQVLSIRELPTGKTSIRFETLILHVATRDILCAKRFLDTIRGAVLKKSGIFSVKQNKVMIECSSTEIMQAPFSENGEILMDESYLIRFIEEANKRLLRANQKIKELEALLRKEFLQN